jgi:hypothetical protein
MTEDDEEFLTETYRNLEKRAIGPRSEFYVALEQRGKVMGADAARLLGTTVTRTSEGSAFFLTGLRGSGKTVQLKRLKADLEKRGFAVLMFSAEDYLNLHDPLEIVDLLFFLVGAISDHAADSDLIARDPVQSRGWRRLNEWLSGLASRVTVATEASGKIGIPQLLEAKVNLKAELRRDSTFVARLREFLDGRLSELIDEANSIVSAIVDEARERWQSGDWRGLVVIVDSLDHNRAADNQQFEKVRLALINLFDRQADALRLQRVRTIFTLPMYVPLTGGVVRRVTNIKLAERDGTPYPDGEQALTDVLTRRIPRSDVVRLFGADAEKSLRELVCASGGHLRDLLMLAMEVVTQAESLPVDSATIGSAVDQVRSGLLPLAGDQRTMLRRVASEKELPLDSQEEWNVVATLLDRHLVLGYQNGTPWYDVHPLLRTEIS